MGHQELPGYYYDAEKNRYFPVRGPIPGSSSNPKTPIAPKQPATTPKRRNQLPKLLRTRELEARSLPFQHHFLDLHLSHPHVWKYVCTGAAGAADALLQHITLGVQNSHGLSDFDSLFAASFSGDISILHFGPHPDNGVTSTPRFVCPETQEPEAPCTTAPPQIWLHPLGSHYLYSTISCVTFPKWLSTFTADANPRVCRGLLTTLGSGTSGGKIFTLNLDEPLDYISSYPALKMLHDVAILKDTIWCADCNRDASKAVIGTSRGAALVNLETGLIMWVLQSNSDVLAQQLDLSGNVVLCGLRNGAIITVDIREQRPSPLSRLRQQHRIPLPPGRQKLNPRKRWFEPYGKIEPSSTIWMSSSVCSLVSLVSYDQYFLASSMDGSIMLYDHRMTMRGAVQAYGGHVNTHSHLRLSVDPSERFLASGGEDGYFRLWKIRSGELLLEERYSGDPPKNISWQTSEGRSYQEHSWSAWFGARDGLYAMRWR